MDEYRFQTYPNVQFRAYDSAFWQSLNIIKLGKTDNDNILEYGNNKYVIKAILDNRAIEECRKKRTLLGNKKPFRIDLLIKPNGSEEVKNYSLSFKDEQTYSDALNFLTIPKPSVNITGGPCPKTKIFNKENMGYATGKDVRGGKTKKNKRKMRRSRKSRKARTKNKVKKENKAKKSRRK